VGTYPGVDPYQAQLKVGFDAAAKALHVKGEWLTSTTFDVAAQLAITQSALSTPNLKGLSVVAADPYSMEGVLKKARAKGIAVSQMSACASQTVTLCYSTDFVKAGEAVAAYMGKAMGGKGVVVIAGGVPGDAAHEQRIKGFDEYLSAHYPNVKVVEVIPNCDDADTTVSCAQDALSAHPNLTGYYGTGGEAADGATTVFPKAGKHVIVAAVDVDPPTAVGLRNGTISVTYAQQPYCQGYMMVLIPYLEAIDHETVSSAIHFVNTGFIIVTKSNLSTYTSQVVPVCNQIIKYITTDVMRKAS
jgi:ABC-type sugar transport system substrate-binding protein